MVEFADFWVPKNESNAKAKSMYMAGVHLFVGILIIISMSIFAKYHSDYKTLYDSWNVMKNIKQAAIALYVVCGLFFALVIVEFVFWLRVEQSRTNGLYKLIMNGISILFAIWGIVCSSIIVHQSRHPNYGNLTAAQDTQTIDQGYSQTKDATVFMLIVWILDIVYDIITLVFFFVDYQTDF